MNNPSNRDSEQSPIPEAEGGATNLDIQIVKSCGDIIQEYLQKNGDAVCRDLRVFCKTKKPIQDEIDSDKGMSEGFRYWFDIEEALEPKVPASLMAGIPIA
ncbi:unnamed protein product [Penicillium nalgiovense]|nr:unnamed protein product [Penicillium nalgiovense]